MQIDKIDSITEQMGNVNREMKVLRNPPPQNTVDQKQHNKNEQLISRLNMADGRIFELKDVSIETSKTEKKREQRLEKRNQNRLLKDYGTTTKSITHI